MLSQLTHCIYQIIPADFVVGPTPVNTSSALDTISSMQEANMSLSNELNIVADDCGGQNKSNAILQSLLLLACRK